jgi:hypothetical protein
VLVADSDAHHSTTAVNGREEAVAILDLRDGVRDTVGAATLTQEQSCSTDSLTGSEGVAWVLKETYAASDHSSCVGVCVSRIDLRIEGSAAGMHR